MKYNTPFADLLPPLSTAEFAALKTDIKKNGVRNPCMIDEEKNVLDGHQRLKINPNAPVVVVTGLSPAQKEAYVLRSATLHRNQSPDQQAEIRQQKRKTAFKLRKEDSKKWTQAAVARELGVAQQTVSDWFSNTDPGNAKIFDARVTVPRQRRPDIVRRVEAGEKVIQVAADLHITPSRVSQIVAQERAITEHREILDAITAKEAGEFDGLYDVIVIDPPWPMKKFELGDTANQTDLDYPTMTEEQLAEMKLPARADSHFWLWTTQRFLPMAFRLLDTWGFRYSCAFVWHKPGGFQVMGLPQFNCEFALYARRGTPKFSTHKDFATCFNAPRGKHSEKPEEFYETVRRVTDGHRIDIFNRRKIEGFDGWGNEAPTQ